MRKLLTLLIIFCGASLFTGCGGGGGIKWPPPPPACVSTATVVCTQSGQVQGAIEGDLRIFRGIPYAAPPVGNLRWRPPAAPQTWSGIRDASKFGNVCPQIDSGGQSAGDENCLVLNIFAINPAANAKQPVMVFFHGGGNIRGSTQEHPFDSPPLAAHGAIVVTAEYRLGLLGFYAHALLTTEGNGSSSNYGIMDQIAVLAWVQKNIAEFGGDPNRVMVFGQSAGGYDVQPLIVSPISQGLFSRAGIESNAIPSGQLVSLAAGEAAGAQLEPLVGCNGAPDVLACLRAVPAMTLVNDQQNGALAFSSMPIEPRVIPVDPFVALQQHGSPVPLLIGSTREESTGFSDDPTVVLTPAQYTTEIHTEFDSFGAGVASQVLSLYPYTDYTNPEYALIAVHSDFDITCEVRSVALVAAGAQRPKVWRYLFAHSFENDASLNALRAFHRSELFFVFGNVQSAPAAIAYTPSAAELALSDQLMGYWTRFAATGDPNDTSGGGATPWLAYDAGNPNVLQLDEVSVNLPGDYHVPQCSYLSTLPQP